MEFEEENKDDRYHVAFPICLYQDTSNINNNNYNNYDIGITSQRPKVWQPFASDISTPPTTISSTNRITSNPHFFRTDPKGQWLETCWDQNNPMNFHPTSKNIHQINNYDALRYFCSSNRIKLLEEWGKITSRMFDLYSLPYFSAYYNTQPMQRSGQGHPSSHGFLTKTENLGLVSKGSQNKEIRHDSLANDSHDADGHLRLAHDVNISSSISRSPAKINHKNIFGKNYFNQNFTDENILHESLAPSNVFQTPTNSHSICLNSCSSNNFEELNNNNYYYNNKYCNNNNKVNDEYDDDGATKISDTNENIRKEIHHETSIDYQILHGCNYECNQCGKKYSSQPAFSMHLRTHNRNSVCPFCSKRFSRPWLLQGHLRTHTGEKPYSCDQCSKCFADKSNLRAHQQTHSGLKPHVCRRCGKAFALKSYLYKHEESSCLRNNNQFMRDQPPGGRNNILIALSFIILFVFRRTLSKLISTRS